MSAFLFWIYAQNDACTQADDDIGLQIANDQVVERITPGETALGGDTVIRSLSSTIP